MSEQVWPWSYLWRNAQAYYYFFQRPISSLAKKQAGAAVKKICARRKELESVGISLNVTSLGSSEFRI